MPPTFDQIVDAVRNGKPIPQDTLKFSDSGVASRWGQESTKIKEVYDQIVKNTGLNPTVTSSFRDPARNAAAGGVPNSLHQTGNAFDIGINDLSPQDRSRVLAEANSIPGIQAFVHKGNHIHVENEGDKNPQPAAPDIFKKINELRGSAQTTPVPAPPPTTPSSSNDSSEESVFDRLEKKPSLSDKIWNPIVDYIDSSP